MYKLEITSYYLQLNIYCNIYPRKNYGGNYYSYFFNYLIILYYVKSRKKPQVKETWEIKDRTYFLRGNKEPLTFTLKSRHTEKYPLLYFDPTTNTQRALRYATNQNSPFVDEQKGEVTLKHIMFKDGTLVVPKEQQSLQKLLSLYHPDLNLRYSNELKPQTIATR